LIRFYKLLLIFILQAAAAANLSAAPAPAEFNYWASNLIIYSFHDGGSGYSAAAVDDANDAAAVISGFPAVDFRPWTNKRRLAGFAETDYGLVIAVNRGYPLFLSAGNSIEAPGRTIADEFSLLTSDRTIGTVFTDGKTVSFHLYRDSLFNPVLTGADPGEKMPVRIDLNRNSQGVFSINLPEYDFSAENPGWEPVEFIHKSGKDLIAWKYTDDKKTRFRYIVHSEDGSSVDEIDESYFRDEYNLTDSESGPFAVRGFVRAVREGAFDESLKDAGDIYIRLSTALPGQGSPMFYYSSAARSTQVFGAGASLPVEFEACLYDDTCYVLYNDLILICGADISLYRLPQLPDGFVYSGIYSDGKNLVAGWEEKRFPFIGRTGMMQIKMRDILN